VPLARKLLQNTLGLGGWSPNPSPTELLPVRAYIPGFGDFSIVDVKCERIPYAVDSHVTRWCSLFDYMTYTGKRCYATKAWSFAVAWARASERSLW
jgi:hypothetical protein